MRKDDHLIFEAFAQQRLLSDEQAAKMIADKIRGTPNLNINTIKQYVSKYLGMVGKAPTDVDYLAAHVHDILSQQGLAGENAEGLSDQEYHKARKDSFELPGEELGQGPIKVRLNKDTRLDCYKSGTVQEVRFSKGTIFNCDENVGDYYECDTEEYGGIAVFPDDVTVLSGEENVENEESADERKERVQRGWDMNKKRWAKWKMENPAAAAKHAAKKAAGKQENAENELHGYPQGMTAIQNLLLNELKKRGFQLTKIVHADKERDKYPTVFMKRSEGPVHGVVEISGMGQINDEPYQEYLANLNDASEDAEDMSQSPFHYDPMHGLASAAHKIKDELKSAANDEARTDHIEKMAEIILGSQSEYASVTQYRRILSGVIELLNHYVMVEMN